MSLSTENLLDAKYELFKLLQYPVAVISSDHIVWVNSAFLTLHDIKKDKLFTEKIMNIESLVFQALKTEEYICHNHKGTHYFQTIQSNLQIEEKQFNAISFFNISKRKSLEEKLKVKQKMFEQFSEQLPEGIVMFKERLIYSNPAFEKLVGYSGRELLTIDFLDLVVTEQREDFRLQLETPLTRKTNKFELVVQLETKKSNKHWVKIKTKVVVQDEEEVYLSMVTNVSYEKLEIDKLHQLAYFDALTGIYNRRKFNEILDTEYKRSKRYQRSLCGLFFDIDHFKSVNDTFGHDVGDEVLKILAQEVSKHVRETDYFARWGGEEFIILLPETNPEQAVSTAEHLRVAINSFNFSKVGTISVSIGITMLKDNERVKTFIKRLDDALYKAKSEGRNRSINL